MLLDGGLALFRGNILLQADDVWQRRDLDDVDAHDHGRGGACLGAHLRPRAGRAAQVEHNASLAQQVVLFVELDQLERRTRPEPLLLGQVVEFV